MPLNTRQVNAIEALDWLLDDLTDNSRRTGRTLTLAIGFVRQAARNPGRWVYVFDHYGGGSRRDLQDNVMRVVSDLVRGSTQLAGHGEDRHDGRFRLNLPEPIDDWLPNLPEYSMEPGEMAERIRLADARSAAQQPRPPPPPAPDPPTWHERLTNEEPL